MCICDDELPAGFYLFAHENVKVFISKKIVINSGKDLKDHTIIVHEGSFSHHLIKNHGWAYDIVAYDDMQEAIQRVSAEDDGIIIWNTRFAAASPKE